MAANAEDIAPFTGIRPAVLSDAPALAALGAEALQKDRVPSQIISHDKLLTLARTCIDGQFHYAGVGVKDNEIVAGLCALEDEQLVYQRKQLSVVQFYTRQPMFGARLIRDFLDFARSRRRVKCISFSLEAGADPRIGKLLSRMGLTLEKHPMWVEWR